MKAATLKTFETVYQQDEDPWRTFTRRDEVIKRQAILHALGPGRQGRLLELGAGAGANSVALAGRSLRLDATDGAASSVRLIVAALHDLPRTHAVRLALPARPPRPVYDAIVIAELLYYLEVSAMREVAHGMRRVLRPGGRLVLAHHHIDFHDFAQPAKGIHRRFMAAADGSWIRTRPSTRTRQWLVESYVLASNSCSGRRSLS